MNLQAARRRQINRKGQPAVLQRLNPDTVSPPISVTLNVFKVPYSRRPSQTADEGNPNDGQAEITNDEIAAASWPEPPQTGDLLQYGSHTWIVVRADEVYEAAVLIGYSLWIRGGT